MPIHDRTYARMEDRETRGTRPAFLAIAGYASKYIRKTKLFWLFVIAAWLPALVWAFLIYTAGQSTHAQRHFRAIVTTVLDVDALATLPVADYRAFAAKYAVLLLSIQAYGLTFLAALCGGGAIAEDTRRHAFELYYSRPITGWSYVAGKWFHVFTRLLLVLLWPTLFVFVVAFIFLPNFFQACWPVSLQAAGGAVLMAACYAVMVLGVSSSVKTARYAVVFWFILAIASMVAGWVLVAMTRETRFEVASFRFAIEHVASSIVGGEPPALPFVEVSERSVPLSAAVLAGWMTLAALLLVRRARKGAQA